MGWIRVLSETYDQCISMVGQEDHDGTLLLPIAHSTANAQVEIVIDMQGNFRRAQAVDKTDTVTVIPVTEDSATRSSGIAPHPLCDKLCYIAGDYGRYQSGKDDKSEYYDAYIKSLEAWASRPDASKKVVAIYKYLIKKSVIGDLVQADVVSLDEAGYLDVSNKVNNISPADLFVRFIVEKPMDYESEAKVWKDTELFTEYERYYMEQKEKKDICYVSGTSIPVAEKHPAKIRNTGDKAKLISSNDTSGFTFRGRFAEAGQAVSVGFATSQKAHNALRWLIQKQGYRNESAVIVSWAVNGSEIPNPMEDTVDLLDGINLEAAEEEYADTGKSFADRLNLAIAGYQANLDTGSRIVVMAVDTADGSSQGRLAITYYGELDGSIFLKNIKQWHSECCWKHTYRKKDGKYIIFVGAPSPYEIALAAYGIDQNGLLKADSRVIKNSVERLLPCIVQGRPVPKDIIRAMAQNAGRPMSLSDYNWSRILSNTCAVLSRAAAEKTRKEQGGEQEERNMTTGTIGEDRSYLFGRLLAVANKAEERTFEKGENRATNAKRYWSAFAKKPAKTWQIIRINLAPYLQKLSISEGRKYENEINEILCMFSDEGFSNEPLSEIYLLGYARQTEALKYTKEAEKEENTMEVTENE